MMLELGDDGVFKGVSKEELVYVDKNILEELLNKYANLEKENERLKTRFKEERELAMKINRKCDALTIKKQELELEIIRLEKIIRTGDDNDCNRTS